MHRYLIILAISILYSSCFYTSSETERQGIRGQTMGTTYSIIYIGNENKKIQKEVEDVLFMINDGLSTWIDSSVINQFNQSESGISIDTTVDKNRYFYENYILANVVHSITEGSYDPTVRPLVEYFGFGSGKPLISTPDSSYVNAIQANIGFEYTSVKPSGKNLFIGKSKPTLELDFSGIAKGYAVDVLSELLIKKGIKNHLVEIGGEVRASGKTELDENWKIGINLPDETASLDAFIITVGISDKSLATSGNYRNYYQNENAKFWHTFDPQTGYPVKNNLLSVTIMTENCAYADALATGLLVSGLEKSKKILELNTDIDACLIYSDEKDEIKYWYSKNFKKNIIDEQIINPTG